MSCKLKLLIAIGFLGLSACAAHTPALAPDAAALSVSQLLGREKALRGRVVEVTGVLCWDRRHEDIFALVDSEGECAGDYSQAVNIRVEERKGWLAATHGSVRVEVMGPFFWCDTCISTGPIQNGTIEATRLIRLESPRR
jgi:hypothetical protein